MSAPATVLMQPCDWPSPPLIGARGPSKRLERFARRLREHVRRLRQSAGTRPPIARWLIDNHSFIQFQIRETRRDLPASFVRKLTSPLDREPRIYRIAADLAAETAGVVDGDLLKSFVPALAGNQHLSLKELWAFGAMLRLAILERLLADLESEPVVSACIRSLRSLETVSWRDFVESASAVEQVLRGDPAAVYARTDFATRDRYRHQVEKLAKQSGLTEVEVAKAVVASAEEAGASDAAHIGHHLVGIGNDAFRQRIGCRRSLRSSVPSILERCAGPLHTCGFLLVTALIVIAFERLVGPLPLWLSALLVIPASQAALEIMNSCASHLLRPRPLSSMDFSAGIPKDCKTMVAVPTLLLSTESVSRLIEDLEIRYLANRDPNLYFGLLTDFLDADCADTARDFVVDVCRDGINRLNARYASGRSGPFYLFHRARQWNPAERKWMGRERKRGKLNDLNMLLLGRGNQFDTIVGDLSQLRGIRYVITLDTDTQLPLETAAKLIGAMAHPLNRPILDPTTQTVIGGYALIRPRVSVSMESAGRSLLSQIFSGLAGFDPYATAVSDVYQDLHGQASFTGKGIYDVRAFDAAAGQRFPDNAILSHDLIEGEHARTGFLTSVELVEDYPATYRAFCRRKHRWVRGDWQLLPWLLPHPPVPDGRAERNPLSLLSRWKIFDNLRRSLVEISVFLLLVSGWIFLGPSARWTLGVLALLQLPAYLDILFSMIRTPERRLLPAFVNHLGWECLKRQRDIVINLVILPHQACLMADAIVRTLVRRFVTKKKLLEWETMAQSEAVSGVGIVEGSLYVSSAGVLLLLFGLGPVDLPVALVCTLWMVAPLFTRWLNQSPPNPAALSDSGRLFLRDAALRTWRFFADHADAGHHWLVPDNVQQDPPLAANRISPTNLGLLLTSQVASHDFGYQTLGELDTSLRRIFVSMEQMPRYRGHFYNWCDTRNLLPMAPYYISTVDSGNLAASLCAVRQGCLALLKQPALGPAVLAGLRDHALRVRDELPYALKSLSIMRLLASLLRQLECEPTDLFFWEAVLTDAKELVQKIRQALATTYDRAQNQHDGAKLRELRYWERQLAKRVDAALSELYRIAPWLAPEFEIELRLNMRDPSLARLAAEIGTVPVLGDLPDVYERIRERLIERLESPEPLYPALRATLQKLLPRLPDAQAFALDLIAGLEGTADDAFRCFDEMDFHFLFDSRRKLLRIGYNVESAQPDDSCYDLLASEARTAVFLAIAKGEIPREAWFRLGRKLTAYRNHRSLVSWSGTMFEHLMPLLHLRTYKNTLLDLAQRKAILIQQAFARERGIPWGISEAAYSERDSLGQYQYRAFGIPALTANPDRAQNLVVAPYASMLALMLEPAHATANLRQLAAMGYLERYGFLESIDYGTSAERTPEPVRCFMAHHQGMGLLAIDNALFGGRMQERLHLDPQVQATEFLLQERMPTLVDVLREEDERSAA